MKRANSEGSIYRNKRQGGYIAAVSIGYNPKTGRLIRRTKHARTKAEAIAAIDDLKRAYKIGSAADMRRRNLFAIISDYIQTDKAPHIRPQSMRIYDNILAKLKTTRLTRLTPETATPSDLQVIVNDIRAPNTRKRTVTLIRAVMNNLHNDGVTQINLAAHLTAGKMPDKKRRTLLDAEQVRRLAASTDYITAMAIQILWATGARAGEVLALSWDDIDFDKYVISITKTTYLNGKVNIGTTKTAESRRNVTIPQKLVALLRSYRKRQAADILQSRDYTNNNLVITYNGQPIISQELNRRITRAAKTLGLGHVTTHCLRHSHTQALISAGWQPKDVQTRLGHADIKTTLGIYAHPDANKQRDIAAYFDAML